MSKKIELERTWCDYLTPCPYLNKEKDDSGIMVGDYECSQCKYFKETHQVNNKGYTDVTKGYVICDYPCEENKEKTKIYGVYFAYNQMEVIGEYDNSKPYYSRELARVCIYKDKFSQVEAYANTMCPASQLVEADSQEEFDKKIEELKNNFENEDWVKENIEPYL